MSLVLPILLFTICLGLFVPRMTLRWWLVVAAWIIVVIVYNYFKRTVVPLPPVNMIGLYGRLYDFTIGKA